MINLPRGFTVQTNPQLTSEFTIRAVKAAEPEWGGAQLKFFQISRACAAKPGHIATDWT